DKEKSRQIFIEILGQYGENKEDFIILKVSNKPDEVFKATALSAVLAAGLNMPEHTGLWNYLENGQVLWGDNKNSETLFDLEKIGYIRQVLPQLKPSPAEVAYTLFGNKEQVKITGGSIHSFQIYPNQVDQLKFNSIKGNVGLSVVSLKSVSEMNIKRDGTVGIERQYLVNGKETTNFKEGDVVEVVLKTKFNAKPLDPQVNEFQVTDILPSGLIPMVKSGSRMSNNALKGKCYVHPYQISGQEVKFMVYRNWTYCSSELRYFAQVKTVGEYLAEPALIQSYIFPEVVNYSDPKTINIAKGK
ncbi:MAG: hypothetical protein WCT36_03825, partial [Candidatus Gracilibacteria bacterium]